MENISTFLMFEGRAEEAMNFYAAAIPGAAILSLEKYEEGQGGPAGSVKHARMSMGNQQFSFIDSPMKHQFGFTPSISIFINCSSEEETDKLFATLSDGGSVMMPLNAYPFAKRFGWVSDKFGVSWQLRYNPS